jgi:hypothetical protein
MSCERESLLTNVTREPTATVMDFGETPLDVMVIVAADEPLVPPPVVGDGELGVLLDPLLPPQPAMAMAAASAAPARHTRYVRIRRTSSRC